MIDLLKLRANGHQRDWNAYLDRCVQSRDLNGLMMTLREIQQGMADLAKKKLNTPDMVQFFLRLQRSLENTVKKIFREKNPNPCDNPLTAAQFLEFQSDKRQRDLELERAMRKGSF